MSTYDDPTQPISPPKPGPAPAPKPTPKDVPPGRSPFPVILAVAFVAVVAAAWYVQGTRKPPASAPATAPGDSSTPTPKPPVASDVATPADLKALKGDFEGLAKKIEELPRPEPAPDLKPIQEKLHGLAESVAATADGTKKFDDAVAKLAESDKTLAALKSDIGALKSEIDALKESMKSRPAEAPKPTADAPKAGVDAAAMTAALDLFKGGKYADAAAALKKLPADDARVLYYTALATGFSTNTWTGETEQTVLKGVAQEKAGSPPKAEIDAAFAGLTKAQGKDWLDAYRARAK